MDPMNVSAKFGVRSFTAPEIIAIEVFGGDCEEKLLWRAYRNSPTLARTVPSSTPYGLLFPVI